MVPNVFGDLARADAYAVCVGNFKTSASFTFPDIAASINPARHMRSNSSQLCSAFHDAAGSAASA
jgi:hypothetical protein